MNRFRQWHALIVLVLGCAFVACSSETGTKSDETAGASDTPATAQSAGGPASLPPANYAGFIDSITCAGISGWQWNSSNSAEKPNIDVFVDNQLVGTAATNLPRTDLKDLTKNTNPEYGFSLPMPPEFKDGKTHVVSAKVSGASQEVKVWQSIKPSFTCSG